MSSDENVQYLQIPYTPRDWVQDKGPGGLSLHYCLKRYNVLVLHRTAGKTHFSINHMIMDASTRENGVFVYVAPQLGQAKKVAWQELKNYLISHIAFGLVEFNESELKITFKSGSIIYVMGADNPDAARGMHLNGLIIDEFGDMPANTWEVFQPATMSKKAWVIFIGTPKGQNAFHDAYLTSQDPQYQDDWYGLKLTVYDTGLYTPEEIEKLANDPIHGKHFAQEWMCDFTASNTGAYYKAQIDQLVEKGAFTKLTYDARYPVHTACDIGMSDAFTMWFVQVIDGEIRVLDYEEHSNLSLGDWADILKSKHYHYGVHLAPHDMHQREMSTGASRKEAASRFGVNFTVLPQLPVADGIEAVRSLLPRCKFDIEKCKHGFTALQNYRPKFDPRLGIMTAKPVHDKFSHGADAFRYLAMGMEEIEGYSGRNLNIEAQGMPRVSSWNPLDGLGGWGAA